MTDLFCSNFDLQTKNSLAVPSVCRWFTSVTDIHEIAAAMAFSREQRLSLAVLGSGTNVVLAEFIDAVVLQIALMGKSLIHKDDHSVVIEVGAGEDWHELVRWCLEQSFFGIENLALIPGTCGAAPIQNIGAYGVELSDVLESVEIFDIAEQQCRWLSAAECELGYRDSVFKHDLENQAIVVSIRLRLSLDEKPNLSYPALVDYLADHKMEPSPQTIFEAVCAIRRSKLPAPAEIPNAGSFFKNPVVDLDKLRVLSQKHPAIPFYELPDEQVKIPAAWFVDQAGFKGRRKSGVGMHDKQALVLVNPGRKPSSDILSFAERVSSKVYSAFGVKLEIEPRVIA